jgi:hypothetical protein
VAECGVGGGRRTASHAIVTVRSCPITWKAIWFTVSGMTGLTLPGMMDEPGAIAAQCRARVALVKFDAGTHVGEVNPSQKRSPRSGVHEACHHTGLRPLGAHSTAGVRVRVKIMGLIIIKN